MKAKKHDGRKASRRRRLPIAPVSEQQVVEQVRSLAEPLCASEGTELIHVEFQREAGGRILRLYVDKPTGITLNDCVGLSRQMGDILDVHLEEIGPYSLEVSSPGSNRPLAQKKDFANFKGSRVKIKTNRAVNGQKNFNGVLLGISGEQVKLQIGDQTIAIPYADISKARLAN